MSFLGDFARSLKPGNDRELAATQYAGRQSASDRASAKRRASFRSKGIARAAKAAEKWEKQDRQRFGGRA